MPAEQKRFYPVRRNDAADKFHVVIDLYLHLFPPKASSAERTRAELELLHGEVDARLSAFQARPGAVCAVREQVFSDLYDEVIREVSGRETILSTRVLDNTRKSRRAHVWSTTLDGNASNVWFTY